MQRYTLDLSEHFSDHRARIFVRRKAHWSRVQCLLDHVRSTFHIQPECYLTNEEDILFPNAEDLDVIQETDRIRVRVSNSCGTQRKGASPKKHAVEARAQNGKRKYAPSSGSGSDGFSSEGSDDDEIETLPKIFSGVEKVLRGGEEKEEEKPAAKPKRKRVRKRKSKKKVEETPPPKVVVKTYGKTKAPPIVIGSGDSSGHVRFEESDKEDEEVKVEPYRNLNQTVTPRVVKAVPIENGLNGWNDDIPAVPEYDVGSVEETGKSRSKNKSSKNSVKIKQETIAAATRDSSPTWDDDPEDPKETFIANHSGVEFYESLKSSIENFPSIGKPSPNDIIACGLAGESYLAFVESVVGGDADQGNEDATKLTLRRLNCNGTASAEVTTTLNQLTDIRLVATYQL